MTVTLDPIQIIVWIIFGGIIGLIAGRMLRRGRGGFGLAGNIIVGIVGALLGGFLFSLLNISIDPSLFSLTILGEVFTIGDILAAIVGAVLFVFLLRFVRR